MSGFRWRMVSPAACSTSSPWASISSLSVPLKLSTIRFGSAPVTLLMPFLIGQKRTRELLMTGDLISASEAERIGLISLCVPEAELEAKALAIATRLAEGAQGAIRHTKLALNNWLRLAGPAFDASLALEFLDMTGPDVHEGVAAVREKRPPKF